MFDDRVSRLLCFLFISQIRASGYTGETQDQTSPKANTLSDDADDIQRQLDNEARDRIKYGRALMKTPPIDYMAASPDPTTFEDWNYKSQNKWYETYPECGGRSQSPVDLPVGGLVKAKGARRLFFGNYNVMPLTLTLVNDGKRVILYGKWPEDHQPLIYGGAAHSRRYVFHSLTLHWPSEHTVGGLQYPMESQALHISAEYKSLKDALQASPSDPQAFLAIANMYKFSNETQTGLAELLHNAVNIGIQNMSIENRPLSYFNPPFKEYACYHGSLPTPPCTESVLWFVRGRTLSVEREVVDASQGILSSNMVPQQLFVRQPQSLNDRKVFLFS